MDNIIKSKLSTNEHHIKATLEEGIPTGGTRDYNKLLNKPSINSTELIGNYNEIDPTVPQWAKDSEPEELTEVDVEFIWRSIFK